MKSGIIYKFNFYFELACTDIGGSNEPCEMAGAMNHVKWREKQVVGKFYCARGGNVF